MKFLTVRPRIGSEYVRLNPGLIVSYEPCFYDNFSRGLIEGASITLLCGKEPLKVVESVEEIDQALKNIGANKP